MVKTIDNVTIASFSVLFVVKDLLDKKNISLSAVIHKDSRKPPIAKGKLYNMHINPKAYCAESFDDDLTDGFKIGEDFEYSKNSLIIIMRGNYNGEVNHTFAATVRDWF